MVNLVQWHICKVATFNYGLFLNEEVFDIASTAS